MTEIKTSIIQREPKKTLKKLEMEVYALESAACHYQAQALAEINPERKELYLQGQRDLENRTNERQKDIQKIKTDGYLF